MSQIGVNYGMQGDNLPTPSQAVNLIRTKRIGKVRLFDANHDALRALANTGITVTVGVGNNELQKVATDPKAAPGWVNDNIKPFYPATKIRHVAVGNEVLASWNRGQYLQYLLPAMRNIQRAVEAAGLQAYVHVSTTHAMDVIATSYPPSNGAFRADDTATMRQILQFLRDHGNAPFMANVYPYFSYRDNPSQISLDYALLRPSAPTVHDGDRTYRSLFDAMVDAVVAACGRLGFPDVPIVVTESGWPSAGAAAASVHNAREYNNNLIRHVLSGKGTPRRPGQQISTFIFALFNENRKGGDEIERHFGLFYPNLSPVYDVNFKP